MAREVEAKVKIEGLSDLLGALHALPASTGKNVLKRVARKRLQPIADAASAKAPRKTGRLSRGVKVSPKLSKRQQRALAKTEGDFAIVMHMGVESGPLSHYAHIDEFGSSRQLPQPYMRPTWDNAKLSIVKDLGADLGAEIDKAAKRVAKKLAKKG